MNIMKTKIEMIKERLYEDSDAIRECMKLVDRGYMTFEKFKEVYNERNELFRLHVIHVINSDEELL